MAVVNIKATAVANGDANPVVRNNANLQNGNLRAHRGFGAVLSTDNIGSVYRLARVRSSDLVDSIVAKFTALGGSCTMDFGLYQTLENGGAVVDADLFASAVSMVTANVAGLDVTNEAAAAGVLLTDIEKRIWEQLALTADPNRYYDVAATVVAVPASNGTIAAKVVVVSAE